MKKFIIFLNLLFSMTYLYSQPNIVVKGTVTDNQKQPMIGVSIVIQGTTKGTVTDLDGKYSIEVPGNGTLLFSYLGYKQQQIAVNNRASIDVTMEENLVSLGEYVVVGYGVQRKLDVTGSIVQIQGADISKQISTNPISALQGKAAGVQVTNNGQPGQAPVIRIRGLGTYWATANPLYVVDGVWLDNVDFLNPGDIESVNILKDASSEAIYGIKGANGVIIITTKKGVLNQKPVVTYNGTVGWQKATNQPTMANANQYAILFNELNAATGSTSSLDPTQFGTGTEWFNQCLRNAVITNHQVSVNGGSEKSTYNFSLGYLYQQGLLKTNDYERYTGNLSNDVNITNNVKVGYSVNGTYSTTSDIPGGIWHQIYTAPPVLPVFFADGTTYGDPGYYGLGSAVSNPQASLDFNHSTTQKYHLNANAYADIKFLKKFTFHSSVGGNYDEDENKAYTPVYSATSTQSNAVSNLAVVRFESRRWIIDNTLTFKDTIASDHSLTVMLGQNAQYYYYDEIHTSAQNVPNETTGNWYLGLGNNSFANDVDHSYNQAYPLQSTIASYFGRINYSFKDRYLLNATMRADGSSKFPASDRWGYFPSVGAGWIISEEGFMKNQDIFNSLKLKASWGKIGNSGVPTFASVQQSVSGGAYSVIYGNSGTVSPGVSVASIPPPALQWERGVGTDVGLEAIILKNRLSIEADYYQKKTEKIIMNVYLPGAAGLSNQFITTNVGDAENKGFELSLTWKENKSKDFNYSISANMSYNQNKFVSNSAGGQKIYDGGIGATGGSFTTVSTIGEPIGSFYGYKVIGIFQTQDEVNNYKDSKGTPYMPGAKPGDFKFAKTSNNGIGQITGNDRVILGNPNPKFAYGLNTYWSYKQFDLSLDFQGVAGVDVYNANKGLRYGAENWTLDFYNKRWHGSGTSNSYPSVNIGGGSNFLPNSWMVESGSYFRIRNVQLGYTFANESIKKLGIQKIRVYANTQNPFTFFKYTGFTPEVGGNPGSAGIDTNVYPLFASYDFGVNVTF
jgi:TonB-linked SusC/RagA family outer membrane protein